MPTCAQCGLPAQSVAANGASRGCLVLFSCSDGTNRWFHRVCAAALMPAAPAPPALFRDEAASLPKLWGAA